VEELMDGDDVYLRNRTTGRPPAELVTKISQVQQVLANLWSLERLKQPLATEAAAAATEAAAPAAAKAKAAAETLDIFRMRAEEYLATQVVGYAEWVVAHLRVLALFLLLSLIFTTMMLYTYPFQPQGLVRILFTLTLLVSVGSVIYVSLQMSRHELLSRIAGTTPGVVTWDARLVTSLLTFGLIPLLTLLGSALPGLRGWAELLMQK
jgi:hypothetical protein